jgi:molybdopterin synthase catalytic subunit
VASDDFVATLSDEPIDVPTVISKITGPEVGGVGIFVGTVRATSSETDNAERTVTSLEYEAHPTLAAERLRGIVNEARSKWGLLDAAVVHRTGRCTLGEVTVVVACSAAHRAAALEACRWIIDTVKTEVPIFKREVYEDGSAWVGAS